MECPNNVANIVFGVIIVSMVIALAYVSSR